MPGSGEGWGGAVYPDAGEGTIWREGGAEGSSLPELVPTVAGPPASAEGARTAGTEAMTGSAEASPPPRARARRRAKGRLRRYAVANRCTRLWTFTYAGRVPSPAEAKRDWARLGRELKARYPGLAWVRVLERGALNGRLHIHAGLSAYVPKTELVRLWGLGFVDARKIRTKRGGGEDARQAARYLAKYATKAAEVEPGEHSYEVAQGHQPVVVRLRAWDRADAWDRAVVHMGGEVPSYQWDCQGDPEWRGPPVVFLAWG